MGTVLPSKNDVLQSEFTIQKTVLYPWTMIMGILVCLTKKDVLQRMQFDTDYDDESLDVEVQLSKQAHMNDWMMA